MDSRYAFTEEGGGLWWWEVEVGGGEDGRNVEEVAEEGEDE